MDTNERELLDSYFEKAVGAAYDVANTLGSGFLEKVYERAMIIELGIRGLRAKAQVPVRIIYKGRPVGDYITDILVEDQLLIELKCADALSNEHMAQCLNYLRASGLHLALLVNFQRSKVEWKRIVMDL